jgi:hypothetical protein
LKYILEIYRKTIAINSVTLRGEHRLRMLENRVLEVNRERGYRGTEEVTGVWKTG